MQNAMQLLQKWLYDVLLVKMTGQVRYHIGQLSALQSLAKSVDLGLLLQFQRKLEEAKKTATHPLNNELQLEGLLVQYTQLFSA
jgi:DNA polymerase-3 subunit delta'